jgi:hypothetical protein
MRRAMLSFSSIVFNNVERPFPNEEESENILVASWQSMASTCIWSLASLDAGAAASIPVRKASIAAFSSGSVIPLLVGVGIKDTPMVTYSLGIFDCPR